MARRRQRRSGAGYFLALQAGRRLAGMVERIRPTISPEPRWQDHALGCECRPCFEAQRPPGGWTLGYGTMSWVKMIGKQKAIGEAPTETTARALDGAELPPPAPVVYRLGKQLPPAA